MLSIKCFDSICTGPHSADNEGDLLDLCDCEARLGNRSACFWLSELRKPHILFAWTGHAVLQRVVASKHAAAFWILRRSVHPLLYYPTEISSCPFMAFCMALILKSGVLMERRHLRPFGTQTSHVEIRTNSFTAELL